MTFKVWNYHFASRDDMLVLTSKNYYKIILTRISWLCNLFHDLTTRNARFIYISSKVMKLWKFIFWATDVKIWNRKHHYKACNSSIHNLHVHIISSDQRWQWRRPKLAVKRSLRSTLAQSCTTLIQWQRDLFFDQKSYWWQEKKWQNSEN